MTFTTEPEPCWEIHTGDGSGPVDNHLGGTAHFDKAAADSELDDHDGATARPLDQPCITAACASCGYRYDEDEVVFHFPTMDEAVRELTTEWNVADGKAYCLAEDCIAAAEKRIAELAAGAGAVSSETTETTETTR